MNVRIRKSQLNKQYNTPGSLAVIMQEILKRENTLRRGQEHFWVIGLNNINKILFIELIGLGAQNRVAASPPDVFRMAIYKLALKLVLVHNHPSGSTRPSRMDGAFTNRMLKAGELLNIDVVDHLVISEEEYYSFNAVGLISKYKKNNSWRITKKEQQELEKIQQEKAAETARLERTVEIAKKLKASGMPETEIRKVTGLTLAQIKKL